jgi:hypothetical protein
MVLLKQCNPTTKSTNQSIIYNNNKKNQIPAISTKSEVSDPSKIHPRKKYFLVMVGFQWTFKNGKNRKIAGFFRGFWGVPTFKF